MENNNLYIYDETISIFIKRMNVDVYYLSKQFNVSIPKVLVYEEASNKKFGYYNKEDEIICLNKILIYSADESFKRYVLFHEFAHHLVSKKVGKHAPSHGKEFKFFCKQLNIPEGSKAKINEIDRSTLNQDKTVSLVEKIKKLLKLASSSNENESSLALEKANQLMLQHNLNLLKNSTSDKQMYLSRSKKFKQYNMKYRCIMAICKTFNVFCVKSSKKQNSKKHYWIEFIGDKANIEIAHEVFDFLDFQLDFLWNQVKTANKLKGLSAKNNFFCGIKNAFIAKQNLISDKIDPNKEIVVYNKSIESFTKEFIYKIKYSTTKMKENKESYRLGLEEGQKLSINKCINNDSSKKLLE